MYVRKFSRVSNNDDSVYNATAKAEAEVKASNGSIVVSICTSGR